MELITNSVVPDRWRNTRVPPSKGEMASTQIMRVKVHSGSAKVREGVPTDERPDVNDDELLERVWTGVVPVYEVLGEPVPGPYNRVLEVPEYVREWRESVGGENERYAVEAARKDAPVVKKKEDGEEV